ncbi:hypothetical protein PENSPDRAFT_600434 [Peniophora sp. CONT]|nr:hypothetical protein PENSPDRAFT_600434 [Peniophora sp. CONT]
MPLLTPPQGPYAVGATTFVLPLNPFIPVGSSKLRNPRSGKLEPALVAEEITFTAFYPTSASSRSTHKKGLDWLARPLKDTIDGYAHFTNISHGVFWAAVLLFGLHLEIPVHQNAAPLHPSSNEDAWPVVLYSHGMGSNNTTYSQTCTHLASYGKIVLAFEHHDGSGPVMRPRSNRTGRTEALHFLHPEYVFWDNGEPCGLDQPSRFRLRAEQIAMRRLEVYLGFRAFSQLVSGQSSALEIIDGTSIPAKWSTGKWVRTDANVAIAGHSFGGGTVIDLLSHPPPEGHDLSPIPISHALALDPWIDAESPNPLPHAAIRPYGSEHPQLIVIAAEKMTLWKEHFQKILDVTSGWKGSVTISIVGSSHISFSDFPVMLPWPLRSSTARPILQVINDISLGFIDNRLPDTISHMKVHDLRVLERKRRWYQFWGPKTQPALAGQPGDLVVHTNPTPVDKHDIRHVSRTL